MKTQTISGVNLIEIPRSYQEDTLAHAVAAGLSKPQKSLPCRFFYDVVGSEIFEQLCELPEYYVTRTERKILEDYAPEIIATAGQGLALVEFGSGSSSKTRLLIDAIFTHQKRLHYIPVDISSEFLLTSSITLLDEYDGLSITAIAAEYNIALPILSQQSQAPRLLLFLGSNIGNFDPGEAVEFISKISQQMAPADQLLIGFDLVKDQGILEAAYNDAAEVTAAFNKNLLTRINTELGGDFDLDGFAHHAPFVAEHSRIEMRLISQREQTVHIDAIDAQFHFEPAEYIHTENSYKYTFDSFGQICHAAGLEIQERWTDERSWFAVVLLRK